MIEIKKCCDDSVFSEFNIEKSPDIVVMAAKDKELVLGVGAAVVKGCCAHLLKIETKEEFRMFEMDFGIGKSVLNMLDLSGVRFVFSDISDKRLMTALGFKEGIEIPEGATEFTDKKYFLSLDGYFTAHNC